MRILFALVACLFAATVEAQTLVTWDDPNPSSALIQGYHLSVDNGTVVTIPYTGTTPCTACVQGTVIIPATGQHLISVTGFNASSESLPATLTVGNAVTILSPTNLRMIITSASGVTIPPATQIYDAVMAVWTINGQATCPAGVPMTICLSIRENNVQRATGDKVKILYGTPGAPSTAIIYARGSDVPTQHWWRRSGSSWIDMGTIEP